MRLAIATQTYDPHVNGQGAFVRHLAEGLAAAGHRVLLLTPSDASRSHRARLAGVDLLRIRALPLPFPDVSVTVLPGPIVGEALRRFRPDVVHIHDHYPLCGSVARWAARLDLPLIATNVFLPLNMIAEVALFRAAPRLTTRILWQTVLNVFGQADVVTTPTETGAEALRRHGLRVPIRAISCGVDLSRFGVATGEPAVSREMVLGAYGLDAGRLVFLYVGRLAREKRLDVLVDAVRAANRQDVQLAIAGRGRYRGALERSARDLLASGRLVFTGFVPDADLPRLLASIDVFAMPSEAELQSIATLEAMAAGRPVLAARACALPELVHDGVNGRLFTPGDVADAASTMADLADLADRPIGDRDDRDDRGDLVAMGAESLRIAQSHALPRTIRAYEALYRSLS